MRRKIPSTAALTAFEAAARHQSFSLAADELAVTQSAVGRQVAGLEEFLGLKLFRRTRHGVALTEPGRQYERTVRQRLDEVERDTLAVMTGVASGGSLDLGVVPTFATHWLIPRLAQFRQAHPGIQVNLHVRTRPFLFADSGLDAAVWAGAGGWPGTRADLLMPESMTVVCAPSLAGRRRRLRPAEVAALPLVQMATRPYAWRRWFEQHGVAAEGHMTGAQVELFSMAVQAAVHGLGAALVPDYLVQGELQRGELVAPLPKSTPSGLGYHFVFPDSPDSREAPREELRAFRQWIVAQAAGEPA